MKNKTEIENKKERKEKRKKERKEKKWGVHLHKWTGPKKERMHVGSLGNARHAK